MQLAPFSAEIVLVARETVNETKRLNIYLNAGQRASIERLRKEWNYGNSNPEVVLRLLDERLKQMIKEGELPKEPSAD